MRMRKCKVVPQGCDVETFFDVGHCCFLKKKRTRTLNTRVVVPKAALKLIVVLLTFSP